ncbi:hypothetical protein F5X99DRAFT_157447 [Biscogniauxia marginata]|nr:hypothetical protein F5X99DRAFT_157447 [Biscogniauxia marginata]
MPVPLRMPVPLPPSGSSDDTLTIWNLLSRQDGQSNGPPEDDRPQGPPNSIWVVVGVVCLVIFIALASVCYLRRGKRRRGKYHQANDTESRQDSSTSTHRRGGDSIAVSETNRDGNRNTTVDRNTSIRSIMTLPAYRNKANENEQVLGREGERDGVDVVVEFPTAEDHEAMRDQEMQTLYQIRETRRQQHEEREERRRLQREARERGDTLALAELRAQRRASNNSQVLQDLRETHEQLKDRRQRAVSSVSYHDIGVARHDGTRIRANSNESERMGLLSDAASIALSTRSPSAQSNRRVSDTGSLAAFSTRSPSAQSFRRERSASSVVSLDDNAEISSPSAVRSGATTPRLSSYSNTHHSRAGSSPEIIGEEDLRDMDMPPPEYEDVSLDDAAPRSGATTPMIYNEPPPEYPDSRTATMIEGDRDEDRQRVSGGDEDLPNPEEPSSAHSRTSNRSSTRGVGGVPQLPSLRIRELPQIVIEPSTAHPDRHP